MGFELPGAKEVKTAKDQAEREYEELWADLNQAALNEDLERFDGDQLKMDLVARYGKYLDHIPEIADRYIELDQKLKDSEGQPVMLVREWRTQDRLISHKDVKLSAYSVILGNSDGGGVKREKIDDGLALTIGVSQSVMVDTNFAGMNRRVRERLKPAPMILSGDLKTMIKYSNLGVGFFREGVDLGTGIINSSERTILTHRNYSTPDIGKIEVLVGRDEIDDWRSRRDRMDYLLTPIREAHTRVGITKLPQPLNNRDEKVLQ